VRRVGLVGKAGVVCVFDENMFMSVAERALRFEVHREAASMLWV
jgi:hypothetical protein